MKNISFYTRIIFVVNLYVSTNFAMDIEPFVSYQTSAIVPQAPLTCEVRESLILEEIKKIEAEKAEVKQLHVQLTCAIYKTHDRKVAIASLISASLIALKTGYDVYRFYQGDTDMWTNKTFFSLDGIAFAGTATAGLFHAVRSCIRKPKNI